MTVPNRNTRWAQVFVAELALAGLRSVCIAPGSRSTSLTLAFAEHPDIAVYTLLDERGAAFFALGMALASNQPVALVCTSGTATVNFHPAVTEAFYAQVPLLVLTADRPPELRHSGANQTIDQVKLYGDHIRWFVDVALPEADPPAVTMRYLRTLACRAMARTISTPVGPVHLNLPFRKPLEPTPVPHDAPDPPDETRRNPDQSYRPFTQITHGRLMPSSDQLKTLTEAIESSARGLIICGLRCPGDGFPQAVTQLARLSGYPILADALSGVRFGPHIDHQQGVILSGYETFLESKPSTAWTPPDLVLRFGAPPISKALGDYLEAQPNCRQIAINESGEWQDAGHILSDFMTADPEQVCRLVSERLADNALSQRDVGWLTQFQEAEQQAWQVFQKTREEAFFEGAILADVVDLISSEVVLFVASSLPVRHLDQFARARPLRLNTFANRGASGIDGTIASGLGAAEASGLPLVLVIGDLAFYHDMNSLLALQQSKIKATIVLINNNGGGIFHRLPISKFEPHFTPLFVTPHGLNFEPVVRMFGAEYVSVTTQESFRLSLQQALAAEAPYVIEVATDAVQHELKRREIIEQISL